MSEKEVNQRGLTDKEIKWMLGLSLIEDEDKSFIIN